VFTVVLLSFMIIKLAPGDPAVLLAGAGATPEYLKAVREAYGLNLPIAQQLTIYLTSVLTGNLGHSITYSRTVIDVILGRLTPTVLLVTTSSVIAIAGGIFLGLFSAAKPNSLRDKLINISSLVLFSVPVFWLGLFMILAFAVNIPLFPTGGMASTTPPTGLYAILDVFWHMVLPVVTLSAVFFGIYARLTRGGLLQALSMNYSVAARAKGLSEREILYHHALRNSLLPIISLAGTQINLMIGALVLVENIFSWPGLGTLIVQGFLHRDYPLTTGLLIFFAIITALMNLFADILNAVVDPRLRSSVGE